MHGEQSWSPSNMAGCHGPIESDSRLTAGPAPALTNGMQQSAVPAALQPIAEALSKADAAAHRSEAMLPTQPAQVQTAS